MKGVVKLATVVEGDQKAPFSIATTPRCRERHYSFPWITPLYPWYVPYITECSARRYQVASLKSLVWRDLGLNPGLPDHWRTLYPLGQWAGSHPYWFPWKSYKCKQRYLLSISETEFILFIEWPLWFHQILHWPWLGCLAFVLDGVSKSIVNSRPKCPRLRLGHLRVGELQYWHLCPPYIALNLAVQFKL